jgi:hypothetical protein
LSLLIFEGRRKRPAHPHLKQKENEMGNAKWILLGVFLVITGLGLLGVGVGGVLSIIAGVCALVAGILFIINR